jgi:hypothetical protein
VSRVQDSEGLGRISRLLGRGVQSVDDLSLGRKQTPKTSPMGPGFRAMFQEDLAGDMGQKIS